MGAFVALVLVTYSGSKIGEAAWCHLRIEVYKYSGTDVQTQEWRDETEELRKYWFYANSCNFIYFFVKFTTVKKQFCRDTEQEKKKKKKHSCKQITQEIKFSKETTCSRSSSGTTRRSFVCIFPLTLFLHCPYFPLLLEGKLDTSNLIYRHAETSNFFTFHYLQIMFCLKYQVLLPLTQLENIPTPHEKYSL